MKIVALVLGIVAVAIAVILLLASRKPATFRVERSAIIKAPPEQVFALLEDFHRWPSWSPWEKKDPAMQRTHSGAPKGVGAAYAWEGNKGVGKGRMEIVDAAPPSHVTVKLDFEKPFEGHNVVRFVLSPEGAATRVTWSMEGPANLMSKVMQVFMSMDRMIGRDFEEGLANLKSVAEK